LEKTRTIYFGEKYGELEVGDIAYIASNTPLTLECGKEISNIPIAYQTYGTLNEDKSNAIFICHALTGDQYVAGINPVTKKDGWWSNAVGEGKPIDTSKFFVICANVLGGCMGSFGSRDINPETNKPYGLDFPIITMGDMVKAQKLLVESFGITKLYSIIGGSMGGMQTLEWMAKYPDMFENAIVIAAASQFSAQNIAFNEVGRQAIMTDPNWHNGDYSAQDTSPKDRLAVARMIAHVTYMSEEALQQKFGRKLQDKQKFTYGFDADFQIESYLRHQGSSFVDRFDANSYLYLTKAMDYFDLSVEYGGNLSNAFKDIKARICIISFSSDWLFPTEGSREIVRALNASAAKVSFVEIESDKGHDAFLLDEPEFLETIEGFLGR